MKEANQPKLGIIAGAGVLPIKLIRFCQETKRPFFVVALKHHAEEDLLPKDISIEWVRLGSVGKIFRLFKQNNVAEIVMIGAVRRPSVWEIWPDLCGLKILTHLGLNKKGDDGLLRNVISVFEKWGFKVRGIHEFLPSLLAPAGVLTEKKPSPQEEADIKHGCYTAKLLGLADVGQSVIMQNGLVLAVEGIEGTQKLLERCTSLRRKGKGGVLVKMMKPQQEERVDLPTIGVKTVEAVAESGLSGIAIEAGKVLMADMDKVLEKASKCGIFIVGVQTEQIIPEKVIAKMQDIHQEMIKEQRGNS